MTPLRIVLVSSKDHGKATFFNALINQKKAIKNMEISIIEKLDLSYAKQLSFDPEISVMVSNEIQTLNTYDIVIFISDITEFVKNNSDVFLLSRIVDETKNSNTIIIPVLNKMDKLHFDNDSFTILDTAHDVCYQCCNGKLNEIMKDSKFVPISAKYAFIYQYLKPKTIEERMQCMMDREMLTDLIKYNLSDQECNDLGITNETISFTESFVRNLVSKIDAGYESTLRNSGFINFQNILRKIIIENEISFKQNYEQFTFPNINFDDKDGINGYMNSLSSESARNAFQKHIIREAQNYCSSRERIIEYGFDENATIDLMTISIDNCLMIIKKISSYIPVTDYHDKIRKLCKHYFLEIIIDFKYVHCPSNFSKFIYYLNKSGINVNEVLNNFFQRLVQTIKEIQEPYDINKEVLHLILKNSKIETKKLLEMLIFRIDYGDWNLEELFIHKEWVKRKFAKKEEKIVMYLMLLDKKYIDRIAINDKIEDFLENPSFGDFFQIDKIILMEIDDF